MIRSTLLAVLMAAPASANLPHLICGNVDHDWTLELLDENAVFRIRGKSTEYDIAHETAATPGPWPIGLTLLSRGDTGIALIHGHEGYTIDFLTQDRQLPVILTGTCAEQ